MALYINDPEVDRLVEQLVALENTSKTEALRRVLRDSVTQKARSLSFASRKAAALRTISEFRKGRGRLKAPPKAASDELYHYLGEARRGH
jgi:hypothetical protein